MTPEAAIDRLEILQLQATYARGVDRADLGLLRSVYWEESTDDHGSFLGPGHAFAERLAERLPDVYESTQHLLGQTWFHALEATRARTETYFRATHAPRDPAAAAFVINGRYLDLLEKRAGEWRILRRELIFDHYFHVALGRSHIEGQVYSGRGAEDRSYGFFARMERFEA